MKKHTNPNALRARASRHIDDKPEHLFAFIGAFAVVITTLSATYGHWQVTSTLDALFRNALVALVSSAFVGIAVAVWVAERVAKTERARARGRITRLIDERDRMSDAYSESVAQYATVRNERETLRQQRNALSDDLTSTVIRLTNVERELARVTRDRDALAETAQRLTDERDALADELARVTRERDENADAVECSNGLARNYERERDAQQERAERLALDLATTRESIYAVAVDILDHADGLDELRATVAENHWHYGRGDECSYGDACEIATSDLVDTVLFRGRVIRRKV